MTSAARHITKLEERPLQGRSLLSDSLRRLIRNPLALFGIQKALRSQALLVV